MLQRFKYAATLVILFAFSPHDSFRDRLEKALSTYYATNLPSRVQLVLNQPYYAPGDTAFYSLFVLETDKPELARGRKIVHVSLEDPSGKTLLRQKVLSTDGRGSNQLVVPSGQTGIFTLHAYVAGNPDYSLPMDLIVTNENLSYQKVVNDVAVFPEGGKFITDVNNRIVISGRPHQLVRIVDEADDEVLSLTLNENGIASTYILPKTGKKYFAKTDDVKVDLPQHQDGVAIVVSVTRKQFPLRVTLQVPEYSNLRSEELHLIVSRHDKVYYSGVIDFRTKPTALAVIPQSGWTTGVMRASVFNGDGTLLSERLFVVENMDSISGEIILNNNEFETRERIVARIKLNGSRNLRSAFSCSVNNAVMLPPDTTYTFEESCYYHADIVPWACASVLEKGVSDEFMITQQWRGPSWTTILNEPYFAKSASYLRIKGTVSADGEPVPDSTLVSLFLQNNIAAYSIYTISGEFDAPLLYFFDGTDEILYKVTAGDQVIHNAEIQLTFDSLPRSCSSYAIMKQGNAYAEFVNQKRPIEQSYRAHLAVDRALPKAVNLNENFEEEIFETDVTFNLSDYKIFSTMEETLREIVHFVQHRRQKGRSVVRVWFDEKDTFAKGDPLYIIDGVLTDDTEYFMSLKPEDVESIKVVYTADKLRVFGKWSENGIILVQTKIRDNWRNVRRNIRSVTFSGLNPQMKLHSPDHSKDSDQAKRIPDLRATLYWNPSAVTDENGEALVSFYAPDNTGVFYFDVKGITEEGIPFSLKKQFIVTRPRPMDQ